MTNRPDPPADFDDTPEWTEADWSRAKPFREGFPAQHAAWKKRSGPGTEPTPDDTADHQRALDRAAEASAEEGIRQGLEDIRRGRVRPADEVFHELRTMRDVSR